MDADLNREGPATPDPPPPVIDVDSRLVACLGHDGPVRFWYQERVADDPEVDRD